MAQNAVFSDSTHQPWRQSVELYAHHIHSDNRHQMLDFQDWNTFSKLLFFSFFFSLKV